MRLTVKQFCIYLRCIKQFDAYDQLRAFEVSTYPYLNKEDRIKLTNKYTQPVSVSSRLISDPKLIEETWQALRARAWRSKQKKL